MATVVRPVSITILNGTAVSGSFPLQPNEHVVGIQTPSAWTAADIGLDVSQDNSTFVQMVDSSRAAATSFLRFTNVAASTYVVAPKSSLTYPSGTSFQRLHSINTANNTDVTQGADRICIVFIGKDT